MDKEILDYYATYKLPNGKWQTTATFENRKEAIESMVFHAQGRRYIIAESEEELEEEKKSIRTKPPRLKKCTGRGSGGL